MSGGFITSAVAAGIALAVLGHSGATAAPAVNPRAAGYINSLAGQQWTLDHTDQGVDYHPVVPEAVRAIGPGTVVYSSTTAGWPGGAFISYKLTSGPQAGGVIYVAEHLTGLLPAGAHLRAGQPIATAWPGYPWTEWGWATCDGTAPAVRYGGAADGTPMPGGLAFARFMRELGAGSAMDPGPGPDVVKGCAAGRRS
jgi:hypothetical protein